MHVYKTHRNFSRERRCASLSLSLFFSRDIIVSRHSSMISYTIIAFICWRTYSNESLHVSPIFKYAGNSLSLSLLLQIKPLQEETNTPTSWNVII